MGYIIERLRALRESDIVAVIGHRRRRIRARVILKDNSLYHTLTKPKTFARHTGSALHGLGLPRGPRRRKRGKQ